MATNFYLGWPISNKMTTHDARVRCASNSELVCSSPCAQKIVIQKFRIKKKWK